MRGLKSTLALAVVLAALGGYIYYDSRRPPSGGDARDRVFDVEADRIQEIRLTARGETSVLRRVDGAWRLVEPVEADADAVAISSLTSNLASLERTRVIDEAPGDLGQYGLEAPPIEVAFTAEGGAGGRIALGETTPTRSDLYARRDDSPAVFLVSAFLETTFDKTPFDLRDKRILRFERDKADHLQIAHGDVRVAAARTGSDWALTEPYSARGDYSAIEGLITRLSTASMRALAEPGTPPAQLGLDRPAVTVTVGSESSRATLVVGRDLDGTVHARDEARGLTFAIDTLLAGDLRKTADDLRAKGLFEFRAFNAERVRLTRGDEVIDLRKEKGEDEDAADVWQRAAADGTTTTLDSAKVDDLLRKLSNARANSFSATTASTGLAQPVLVAEATYDGGKTESVRFARSGAEAFAARDGEPGAARIDMSALDEVLQAIDAVLAPPETG